MRNAAKARRNPALDSRCADLSKLRGGEPGSVPRVRDLRHEPVPATVAQGVRRTVSVVFTDLRDSTNLGERLDTESLREVLSVYFDEMRTVLERHGGTVEKFIGDAIMAVFGLPKLHEDDAVRAVRAALRHADALGSSTRASTRDGACAGQPDGREHW